uniref:Uncharacterized protein n=1 Tax=Ditylenchus dipsaci TaxID=166011 RepID=A0A915DGG5_9BILA
MFFEIRKIVEKDRLFNTERDSHYYYQKEQHSPRTGNHLHQIERNEQKKVSGAAVLEQQYRTAPFLPDLALYLGKKDQSSSTLEEEEPKQLKNHCYYYGGGGSGAEQRKCMRSAGRNHSPRMKVFTVGLDQKPPIKDASDSATPEKTNGGSPPPGYVPTQNVKHIPLPIGPEIPQPPHPIIMRKSRGYKGILMVMLSVFLMALFALTLSEIAYNRQRDENFFRLRWAELKHRLGYGDNAYDYYHRANAVHSADRYFSLSKNKEMAEALIQQASESSSTTTSSISSTSEPVVAIDSFPPKPSSFEQQQQQGEGMIRDARLQFLKTILQKIKQHAEDMGFDGTMQVSVIEMEPQTDEQFSPFGGQHLNQQHQIPKGQSFHPLLPNFFPHLPIEDSSNNQQQQAPKSTRSWTDSVSTTSQPSCKTTRWLSKTEPTVSVGLLGGDGRERRTTITNNSSNHNSLTMENSGCHWHAMAPRQQQPLPPESFFHPMNNWQMLSQQQQQQFPQPPHILPRPPSFDRWSGGNAGPQQAEGEDNTHGLQHQQQPHQPMIQVFLNNQPCLCFLRCNASPSQEVVGEIYGRKFGRMLQDIIANRIQGFQNMQQLDLSSLNKGSTTLSRDHEPNNMGGNQGPPPPMGPLSSHLHHPSHYLPANGHATAVVATATTRKQPTATANSPLQHGDENPGKLLKNRGCRPSSSHFLPDGSRQAQNGQPQPFPAFAKEVMGGGQQRKDFGVQQQLQFQYSRFSSVLGKERPSSSTLEEEEPKQLKNHCYYLWWWWKWCRTKKMYEYIPSTTLVPLQYPSK